MSSPSTRATQSTGAPRHPGRAFWRVAGVMLLQLSLVVALTVIFDQWVRSRYRLLVDPSKGERCLPYWSYFVDLRERTIRRGDYVLFSSRGMTPFYPDGT